MVDLPSGTVVTDAAIVGEVEKVVFIVLGTHGLEFRSQALEHICQASDGVTPFVHLRRFLCNSVAINTLSP